MHNPTCVQSHHNTMEIRNQHIEILDYIARRRFVTIQDISRGLGSSINSLFKPVAFLTEERYLSREELPRRGLRGGRNPFVYRIEKRGINAIRHLETVTPKRFHCLQHHARNESREHALMITRFLSKAEESARKHPERAFIAPYEIKRRLYGIPKQLSWPVLVAFKGKEARTRVVPDEVFGILDEGNQSIDYYFLEADRGTMPIDPENPERSSLAKKVAAYHTSLMQGLYTHRFGIKSVRVIFFVPKEPRLKSLINLCTRYRHGRGMFLGVDERTFDAHSNLFEIPFISGNGKTRDLQ